MFGRTALVAATLALAPACAREPGEPAPAPGPRGDAVREVQLAPSALEAAGLRVAAARAGSRRSVITAAGTLEFAPRNVARVGPLVDSRVVSVRVEPGQQVDAGTVLATVQSSEVGRARAEMLSAAARSRLARAELERQRFMADAGVTTGRELLTAQTQRSLTELEMAAAAARLRALGAARADPGAGTAAMPLVTPMAGVVLAVDARVGQAVGATDTLFVVGRTDEVWLVIDVYERDYARVRVGDPARVTLVAYPGRVFAGRVDHVGGIVDPATRAAPVRVSLPNPDGALRPGMSATARIEHAGDPGEPVVVVPRGAVQTIDGQPFVFVERARGRYEVRPIDRGDEADGEVEVRRGLRAGEPVVVDGAFILKSEVLREQMGKND